MILTSQKLTFDTDAGRINSYPSVVVDSIGRYTIFYEKFLTTGLSAYSPSSSYITWTAPFSISVPAGSGSINGTGVAWSATVLSAASDTYQLIYIDMSGTVTITATWDMTVVKDVIILAFVYTGLGSIVFMERFEKTGKYVFTRTQVSPGVWDNKEYILNVGEQPKPFIDVATDKIYISYMKDGAAYVRVIDFTDPLTLSYLPHTTLSVGDTQINMNPYPQGSLDTGIATGYEGTISSENADLYPFGAVGVRYDNILGTYYPFAHIPLLTGSYLSSIVYDYHIEYFSLAGPVYTLVHSEAVSNNATDLRTLDRWFQWTHGNGTFYVGVRVANTLVGGDFVTLPVNYKQIKVYAPFELTDIGITLISNEITDRRTDMGIATGYEGSASIVLSYDETRDFETDSLITGIATGYEGKEDIILSYDETRDFETDSNALGIATGYQGVITVT